MSIITSPVTASPCPSRVTRPARIIGAGWTRATSAIVTGTPPRSSMTIAAMSAASCTWLSPRMYRASPSRTM